MTDDADGSAQDVGAAMEASRKMRSAAIVEACCKKSEGEKEK